MIFLHICCAILYLWKVHLWRKKSLTLFRLATRATASAALLIFLSQSGNEQVQSHDPFPRFFWRYCGSAHDHSCFFPVRVCHFPYAARGKNFPPVPSECQIWLFQRNHNCFIWKRNQIISSVFIVLILMLASSLCMYSVEHDAQPEVFRNAFSGIWWSMSTLLTVGYGDIYPITTLATCASAKRHDFEIEWYYYYTWGEWLNIRGSNDSCFVTKRHRKGCIPLNCTLHIFWKFGLTTTLFWYSINRRKWVFQPYSFYSCGSLVSFFILKISYKYNLLSRACLITILPLKILYPVNSPSLLYLGTANLVS